MSAAALEGYAADAATLIPLFEAISPAELYAPVAHLLPEAPSRIADVGAGTGRDAAWFAARGHGVLAVEPVAALREAGAALHPSPRLEWLDDRLPDLQVVLARGETFDRVLLTGVWQHVRPQDRPAAMAALARLVAPRGLLIMSVRRGPGAPTRPVHRAPPDEAVRLAQDEGLVLVHRRGTPSLQAANRAAGVTWTWLAFQPKGAG